MKRITLGMVMFASAMAFAEEPDSFASSVVSTGEQWVDTGVVATGDIRVEMDFMPLTSPNPAMFFAASGGSTKQFRMLGYWSGFRPIYAGDWDFKGPDFKIGRIYNAVCECRPGYQYYNVNGTYEQTRTTANEVNLTQTFYVFACNDSGTATHLSSIRLFGLKVWSAGELVRDYRPCVKGGRVGLYDAVNETIAYSGSGTDLVLAKATHEVWPTATGGKTPGEQLIAAATAAQTGDRILLHNGTYAFADGEYMGTLKGGLIKHRLEFTVPGVEMLGETATSRKTWTAGAEPVVVDGNGARILDVRAIGFVVRNIAFTGADGGQDIASSSDMAPRGGVIRAAASNGLPSDTLAENCVFRGNVSNGGGAAYAITAKNCLFSGNEAKASGGALWYSAASGCDFVGNAASGNGGAVFEPRLDLADCTIRNCTAAQGGAVYASYDPATTNRFVDCVFSGNTASSKGGAVYFATSTSKARGVGNLYVEGCTFTNNVATGTGGAFCNSAVGYAGADKAWRSTVYCTNTVFACNRAAHDAGLMGGVAVDCRFYDNAKSISASYAMGGDAVGCELTLCELTGGEIIASTLDRCYVHGVTNECVFKGCNVATNTLVVNCTPRETVFYQYNAGDLTGSAYVNCTFADNARWFFQTTCAGVGVSFVNTALFRNKGSDGVATAIPLQAAPDTWLAANPGVTFANCGYGPLSPAFTVPGSGNVFAAFAMFNRKAEGALAYQPRRSSALRSKGLLLNYTAASRDLAGNPRMDNNTVDIGCYQCVAKENGLVIVVE